MKTQPGAGEAFDSAGEGGDARPQDLFFSPHPALKSLCQLIWAGAAGGHWFHPRAAEYQDSLGLSPREMGHGQTRSNPTLDSHNTSTAWRNKILGLLGCVGHGKTSGWDVAHAEELQLLFVG